MTTELSAEKLSADERRSLRPAATVAGALGLLFTLCVIAQFFVAGGAAPAGSDVTAPATSAVSTGSTHDLLSFFIIGATLVILFVAAVLIDTARRHRGN